MKSSLLVLALLLVSAFALYDNNSKVVKLTKDNFKTEVLDSKQNWIVQFYTPWNGDCKDFEAKFEKAAEGLEGIVKLGAVDMTSDQEVGGPYNIKGFPTLKFFGENKSAPVDYLGEKDDQELIDFGFDQVKKARTGKSGSDSKSETKKEAKKEKKEETKKDEVDDSDVVVLEESTFDETVMQSKEAWFIEFYAPWCQHCKKLQPEWNAMAKELKGQVNVGKVDSTVHKTISEKIKVEGYPTIYFLPLGAKLLETAIKYDGARSKEPMKAWALEQLEKTKPLRLEQLVNKEIFSEVCDAEGFNGVCIITFLPHIIDSSASDRRNYLQVVEDISNLSRGKPFAFLWTQAGDHFSFEEQFALVGSGFPAVMALSVKKNVYSIMRGSFSKDTFDSFLKNLVSGNEGLIPYKNQPKISNAKPWDGQDYVPPKSEDL